MLPTDGLILKRKLDDIPAGAISITKRQAAKQQWNLVKSYSPAREIWPLRFGHMILGSLTAATSIFITNYFRRRLKLGTFGQITTHIPTVLVPSVYASFAHNQIVVSSILLQEDCPICVQTRSTAVHVGVAVLYPLLVAPPISLSYAYYYGSYNVPTVARENIDKIFRLVWNMIYRYRTNLSIFIAGNAIAAMGLTYMENRYFLKMHVKIIKDRLTTDKMIRNNSAKENVPTNVESDK